MPQEACQRCRRPVEQEELTLFWTFNICDCCNRELAGVLRRTVNVFIGLPETKNPDQLSLL